MYQPPPGGTPPAGFPPAATLPGYPQGPPPGYSPSPSYPPPMGYPYPGGYPPPYGYMPMMPAGPAPGIAYASFLRRFGAYLLDTLILWVPSSVIVFGIFASLFSSVSTRPVTSANFSNFFLGIYVAYALIGLIFAIYYTAMLAATGATLGQKVVGISVVREEDLTRLPYGRAFLRSMAHWVPYVTAIVFGLGTLLVFVSFFMLLWAAWDPRIQGLHDKMGRALVIKPMAMMYMPPPWGMPYPYGAPPSGYGAPPPGLSPR